MVSYEATEDPCYSDITIRADSPVEVWEALELDLYLTREEYHGSKDVTVKLSQLIDAVFLDLPGETGAEEERAFPLYGAEEHPWPEEFSDYLHFQYGGNKRGLEIGLDICDGWGSAVAGVEAQLQKDVVGVIRDEDVVLGAAAGAISGGALQSRPISSLCRS